MQFKNRFLVCSYYLKKGLILTNLDQYLTHYWPILNGTMLDTIGSSHMTQGNLTSFASDRFGNTNSALALNGGWTQVPGGVYFDSSEFTISLWIYPKSIGSYARVIDFGNGPSDNIIGVTLSDAATLKPYAKIYIGTIGIFKSLSNQSLTLNTWQFLTATFNGTTASIYLNGTLKASDTRNQSYVLSYLIRTKCYIGRSNFAGDGYSSSYVDDLRFYSKSLTQTEIIEVMYDNRTCNDLVYSKK